MCVQRLVIKIWIWTLFFLLLSSVRLSLCVVRTWFSLVYIEKKWMFVRRFPPEQGSYQGYIYITVEKLNERNSVPQDWLDFSVASRSFFISFTINNLTDTVYLPSLGKHWIMRKFEEYIIKIGLKANLDRLVVMQAIFMIWN